jgi:hypothetical protein
LHQPPSLCSRRPGTVSDQAFGLLYYTNSPPSRTKTGDFTPDFLPEKSKTEKIEKMFDFWVDKLEHMLYSCIEQKFCSASEREKSPVFWTIPML